MSDERMPQADTEPRRRRTAALPDFRAGAAKDQSVPSYYRSAWDGHKRGTNGADSANRVHFVVRIRTQLDVNAFCDAFSRVVLRHDILQSALEDVEGSPVIVPSARTASLLQHHSIQSGKSLVERARALASELVWHRLDPSVELYRAFLIKLGVCDHVFGFVLHHFIGDGFSIQLLYREIRDTYDILATGKRLRLERPAFQYADYLVAIQLWRNTRAAARNMRYWVDKLKATHNLVGRKAVRWDSPWLRRPLLIDRECTAALRELARKNKTTLFVVLTAIQLIIVARLVERDNVAIAAITSGREVMVLRDVIGRFADRTYHAASLEGDLSFLELVNRVRDDVRDSAIHPFVRFDMLQEELERDRICVVAPIFNFRSLGAKRRPEPHDWKPFAINAPSGVSRLGNTVHFYWLEMWDLGSEIQGSLRCQEVAAGPLLNAIEEVVAAVIASPDVPLSCLHACGAERFAPLRALKTSEPN